MGTWEVAVRRSCEWWTLVDYVSDGGFFFTVWSEWSRLFLSFHFSLGSLHLEEWSWLLLDQRRRLELPFLGSGSCFVFISFARLVRLGRLF